MRPRGFSSTASRKHAAKKHHCRCGREIKGNAYYHHKVKCDNGMGEVKTGGGKP